jgi:fatty-acyl-CoA synthase
MTTHPPIRSLADIEALERIPLDQRIVSWDVFELIRRGAAKNPEKIGFIYLEDADLDAPPFELSYRELMGRFTQAANLFHRLGVGPRDAVCTLMPTVPEIFYAQIGGTAAGIACHVNWMLEAAPLADILRVARTKVLVAQGPAEGLDIWPKVERIRAALPGMQVLTVEEFAARMAAEPADRLTFDRRRGPDDIAAYVHSGGTTGTPKLAKIAHRGLAFKCWANSVIMAHDEDETIFADYPMFHIAGFFGRAVLPFSNGARVVVPSKMGARSKRFIANYWKLVERYRISLLSGVPTTLSVLAASDTGGADISSLKPYAPTGSAPLPAEVARKIEAKFGVRMIATFGATEFTQNATQPPKDGDPRYGSTGLRLPYMQVKTVALDGKGGFARECAPEEIGVIVVKGPSIIPGYVDPSYDKALFVGDGWVNSGDLGRIDTDGYLWVTGRAKDLIIRGGHNIEPAVIEETLLAHEAVQLAAAVGKPDAYAGELPVAYVQLREGARVTAEELAAFARARITERAAAPAEVFILDKIPLTDIGKPMKAELRHEAARHVFETALSSQGVRAKVAVGAHKVHGTLATVTLANGEDEAKVHKALDPFAIKHEILRGA